MSSRVNLDPVDQSVHSNAPRIAEIVEDPGPVAANIFHDLGVV